MTQKDRFKKDIEYRNTGPEVMTASRMNNYDFCERLFELRHMKGYEMEKSQALLVGHDIHEILFWYYKALEDNKPLKNYILAAVNMKEGVITTRIAEIFDHVLPDDVKKHGTLMDMVSNFVKLEARKLKGMKKYFKTVTVAHLNKYYIPVLYEKCFYRASVTVKDDLIIKDETYDANWEDEKYYSINVLAGDFKEDPQCLNKDYEGLRPYSVPKSSIVGVEKIAGTPDRVDKLPPDYKFEWKKKNVPVLYAVGDYKSNTPKYLLDWLEMSPAERVEKKLEKPKLTTRYRRQLSMYVDFVADHFGCNREDIMVYIIFLNTGLIVPEIIGKRTYTYRDKLIVKLRNKIETYPDSEFAAKPYYKKCRKCGAADYCAEWLHQKGFTGITVEK